MMNPPQGSSILSKHRLLVLVAIFSIAFCATYCIAAYMQGQSFLFTQSAALPSLAQVHIWSKQSFVSKPTSPARATSLGSPTFVPGNHLQGGPLVHSSIAPVIYDSSESIAAFSLLVLLFIAIVYRKHLFAGKRGSAMRPLCLTPPPQATAAQPALTRRNAHALAFSVAIAPKSALAVLPAPAITSRVYFIVKVARRDGSLDARDYDPEPPYSAKIVFGLYGDAAPNTVARFLAYVGQSPPSLSQSTFFRLTRDMLLEGGRIYGLRVGEVAGTTAVLYTPYQLLGVASTDINRSKGFDNQVLPLELGKLAIDVNRLSHDRRGLLTHAKAQVLPEFGITLAPAFELDDDNVVFGELLEGEEFLRYMESLPVVKPLGGVLGGLVNKSKQVRQQVAPVFRDARMEAVYPNKLLRRVLVVDCGIID